MTSAMWGLGRTNFDMHKWVELNPNPNPYSYQNVSAFQVAKLGTNMKCGENSFFLTLSGSTWNELIL